MCILNDRSAIYNHELIAHAPESINLFTSVQRLTQFPASVLITGETGSGKGFLARYIHRCTRENNAPYVEIYCDALTQFAEKFSQACGGTLVIKNIGNLPLGRQNELLSMLEEQESANFGTVPPVHLIVTTNRDLYDEVSAGRFNGDLFYRIAVLSLHVSPLRDRKQDILPLFMHFMHKYGACQPETKSLSEEARLAMLNHAWPGNLRELENAVQRSLILSDEHKITTADLGIASPYPATATEQAAIVNVRQQGRRAEHDYILGLLERHGGNKTKTAAFLGITPRALRYRLASMRDKS